VLAHWNNNPRVDMSLHSDTLFWFRANQLLLFLLNAACLAEKQHIQIWIFFRLTRPGLEPTIYCAQDEQANHYATEVVVLVMIEERKNLREKENIYYHLRYGYFVTVNQIEMTTYNFCSDHLNLGTTYRYHCLSSFCVSSWALSRQSLYCVHALY
jgi:hypothetical protein